MMEQLSHHQLDDNGDNIRVNPRRYPNNPSTPPSRKRMNEDGRPADSLQVDDWVDTSKSRPNPF